MLNNMMTNLINSNPMFKQMSSVLQMAQNPFIAAKQFAGNNQQLLETLDILSKKTPTDAQKYMQNLFEGQNVKLSQFGLNIK